MTEFVASNGIEITIDPDGGGDVYLVAHRDRNGDGEHLDTYANAGPEGISALREFFQHERDEELGRWRWPDNPDYVVYPATVKSRVRVLRETGMGDLEWVDRGDGRPYEFCHAARAYFEAHPERKPNPWDGATYKDVWVWTTADDTQEALGWVAGDGSWDIITPRGDGIKAADNPLTALVESGFEKFSGEVKGTKRTPEDAS